MAPSNGTNQDLAIHDDRDYVREYVNNMLDDADDRSTRTHWLYDSERTMQPIPDHMYDEVMQIILSQIRRWMQWDSDVFCILNYVLRALNCWICCVISYSCDRHWNRIDGCHVVGVKRGDPSVPSGKHGRNASRRRQGNGYFGVQVAVDPVKAKRVSKVMYLIKYTDFFFDFF